MTKQKTNSENQSIEFYIGLVIQRVSLLLAAASTIILWATLISIGQSVNFVGLQGTKITNPVAVNTGITNELIKLTHVAVFFSLFTLVVTLLFMLLPRVKKYEKKLIVNGVVIAVFCFIFALYCQHIFQYILSHILV